MSVKELNMEQLENVSGGTVNEYEEVLRAAFTKMGGSAEWAVDLGSHFPIANEEASNSVYLYLRDKCGIRAVFDFGFLGTGIGSGPNKYTDYNTKQPLTHQQVIERLTRK